MENKVAERHLLPNGTVVDYVDETHTYSINGVVLPSITTIIANHYGNLYTAVRPDILKASAEYGTKVHAELSNMIEMRFECPGVPLISDLPEVSNYFNLIEKIYKIEPVMTEKVVVLYDEDGIPVACGRFDLLCRVAGRLTMSDFKTTSTIHREAVSAQLNLYARAALQSGYITQEEYDNIALGVIHLHGSTAKYAPMVKFADSFYLQFVI